MYKIEKIEIIDEPVQKHLAVSGLLLTILRRFQIVTIGQLLSIDLEKVLEQKGVGEKKYELLKQLASDARNLIGEMSKEAQAATRIHVRDEIDLYEASPEDIA